MGDRVGGWKTEHRFISERAIYISMLILGFLVAAALLIYQNYMYAR
jgi:hypothetical protein